ncbi:ester cyclase [Streptomyces spectabilis]|uniref:Ester cyclase n=1 Tax=Streptomyces spectabilis TaxID=68270 RepID=A0A516RHS1_STRST|nr:nuclear transport factor 2 family protein [Streptomyces spectabilis]QDQ15199.1 ester cyclase [Streptomyces spectabilis]
MHAEKFVQEWASAYNDQDFDRFGALFTDDVAYTLKAFGLAFTGRDAWVNHVREYAAAVPDRKLTLRRTVADGDTIAVEYDFAGTSAGILPNLPPKGEPVTVSFCTILRLRGEQAASQVDYLGG